MSTIDDGFIPISEFDFYQFVFLRRKGLNDAQNVAVKNIIQGSSQPYPFILLGLAGNC